MKELYLLDLIDEETKNAIVGYKWGVHARSFILFHESNFVKKGDKIAYLFVRCFSSEENRFESCDDSSCIMEKLHISQPYITSMLKDGVSDSYDIFAKEDGFYKFMCQHLLVTGAFLQEELANKVKWFESNVERNFNENPLLFVVYETIVEYCRHEFCKYTIIKDEFSGTKCIKWNNRMGFPIKQDSNYMSCKFDGGGDKSDLLFEYRNSFPNYSDITLKTITRIHFLFDEHTVLSYQIDKKLSDYDKNEKVTFRIKLPSNHLSIWKRLPLIQVRIETSKGVFFDFPILGQDAEGLLCIVDTFCHALTECGYELLSEEATSNYESDGNSFSNSSVSDSCFVYLMKDETNGYFKIGISNNPKYRERTLQSEKPTIVLICAKEFPTRLIAESIESALHKAFGGKRLRGEWFNLDAKDEEDLKKTLA